MEPGEAVSFSLAQHSEVHKNMVQESEEQLGSQTIVDVNEFVKNKVPQAIDMEAGAGPAVGERRLPVSDFKIRLADTMGRRSSASMLIEKMYSWRGYQTASAVSDVRPNRVTLVASAADQTIGTITIGFDSEVGLLVDQLFAAEIAPMRIGNNRLCEFTKLAVDASVRSKRVLASLFHIAHIFAHHIRGCSHLMVEVNPRHVKFYQQMLGFKRVGQEKLNPRVNAPAVLLVLDLVLVNEQICKFGGHSELASFERTLYPFAFSPLEEKGIIGRLRRL